jgi:hypothetical protein
MNIKKEVEEKIKTESRAGDYDESFPLSNIVSGELEYYLKKSRRENYYVPLEVIADVIYRTLMPEETDKLIENIQNLQLGGNDIRVLMS